MSTEKKARKQEGKQDEKDEKDLCDKLEQMCIEFSTKEEQEHVNTRFEGTHSEFKENVRKSKEVFGLIMRGSFGRYDDQKFQPCKDELDLLKSLPKAMNLCRDLRRSVSLRDFYQILLPGELSRDEKKIIGNPIDYLKKQDTIFHIAQNDRKEFEDLEKRAKRLAQEMNEEGIITEVQLLDGHGRMLVLILRALDKVKLNLEDITFKVFEIDDIVNEYHKYVFHNRISCLKQCIINQNPLPMNKMIYLNFCSIPSTKAFDWTEHFENNTGDTACVKENVLKFIASVTSNERVPDSPTPNCTVMISFVLKHSMDDYVYQAEFKKTMGHYLTGLGFFRALLRDFNAEIVSIRPKTEIIWEDQEKKETPINLRSGGHGCPFITLLVKPGNYQENLDDLFEKGFASEYCKDEETGNIADLKEKLRIGSSVEITSGINKGKRGSVVSRTAAQAGVNLNNGKRVRPYISQLELIR